MKRLMRIRRRDGVVQRYRIGRTRRSDALTEAINEQIILIKKKKAEKEAKKQQEQPPKKDNESDVDPLTAALNEQIREFEAAKPTEFAKKKGRGGVKRIVDVSKLKVKILIPIQGSKMYRDFDKIAEKYYVDPATGDVKADMERISWAIPDIDKTKPLKKVRITKNGNIAAVDEVKLDE